ELGVLILEVFEPCLLKRLGDRLGVTIPQIGKDAADWDGAILAMPWPVKIHVAFDLFEIRQNRVPIPSRCAARLPFVVVPRLSPIEELGIDGRATAHHSRLPVF